MKDFEIITKKHCGRCDILKRWFRENGISYREAQVDSLEVPQNLLNDSKFRDKFCTSDKCKFLVPLLHLTESGEYYHKYMFGIDGIRTKFIRDLLEVDGNNNKNGKWTDDFLEHNAPLWVDTLMDLLIFLMNLYFFNFD